MYLWTAFTIGILGSFHCIGMCGPLALSLPYAQVPGGSEVKNALFYNLGRIVTYATLGLVPGLIGQGLTLAGFQQGLSLVLGVLLLSGAMLAIPFEKQIQKLPVIRKFQAWLQKKLGMLLKSHGSAPFIGIGILNGFLPCGLVYMALAGALTQTHFWEGSLYMMVFGLGTLPLMLLLGLGRQVLGLRTRNLFRRLVPIFMFLIAVLLIVRGLAVELPGNLEEMISMGVIPMCR